MPDNPRYGNPYGPPAEVREAAHEASRQVRGDDGLYRRRVDAAIDALHNPAHGLDGSIRKRAVIEWLRGVADSHWSGPHAPTHLLADQLEREWSDAR